MSYKIGLILSMVFVALFFMFGADLFTLNGVYSALDAKANNISYLISRNGAITDDFVYYLETTFSVEFECPRNPSPAFGEKIIYQISTTYHPLVISKDEMVITIKRMTIVGFYGQKGGKSMSEIKGQLLGIVLVLMVFGIVATALTTIFTGLSSSVTSEVSKAVSSYGIQLKTKRTNNGFKRPFFGIEAFYSWL